MPRLVAIAFTASWLASMAFVVCGCRSGRGADAGASPSPAVDVAVSTDALSDPDEIELRALLLLLVDRQVYEPYTVERALVGGPEIRRELARALGRVPDRRAVPLLVELAEDSEAAVRRAAVFALGEHEAAGAVASLSRRVVDPDSETGRLAVEALAKAGASLVTVEEALAELSDEERRRRLLPSLYRFDERSSLPVAAEMAGDADVGRELHRLAVYAMARDAIPEAAPHLRAYLDDPDPWIRGWAARALGEVGDRSDLARIRALLDDEASGPVIQALRAGRRLLSRGVAAADEDWRAAVLALLEDERIDVRLTALEVAGVWLRDERLERKLARRFGEGPARERELALLALAEGKSARADEALGVATRSLDASLRHAAASAAAALGRADILERLARDASPAVRSAALQGRLAELPEADATGVAEAAVGDPDAGVRATALEWFREHPRVPAAVLWRAVERSADDLIPDARLAGVRALAARGVRAPAEGETVARGLATMAQEGDYIVRRAAIEQLRELEREGALRGIDVVVPELGAVHRRLTLVDYEQIVVRSRHSRRLAILTEVGGITVELDCPRFPLTCLNFTSLAEQGFYDGLSFHRVVPGFVVQGGDPRGDGRGGPGYRVRDEIGRLRYDRGGVVGMAHSGPDSAGSQFFVTLSAQPHLDGEYTAFGVVVEGLDLLDRIVQGDRIETVREVGGG